jgi:hypothetical protein
MLCRCVFLSGGTGTSIQVMNPEFALYVGVEGKGVCIGSYLLHASSIGLESSAKLSLSRLQAVICYPSAAIL